MCVCVCAYGDGANIIENVCSEILEKNLDVIMALPARIPPSLLGVISDFEMSLTSSIKIESGGGIKRIGISIGILVQFCTRPPLPPG